MQHEKKADLRMRAEEALLVQTEDPHELSTRDIESLVHELQVHQIELEMQNEELCRAQNELEDSRNRYLDLYDFAPIGYFTFDKNGLIQDVNLTGAHKLGIERSFLIKKPFSLYIAPEDKDAFYLHLRRVFGTRSRQICELKLAGRDGRQFDSRLESLLVQDEDGKHGQCRTVLSDITERKRALETIRESEERYRNLVESANDIIATVSPDGTIISLNPAFERITGWTREEWLGKSFQPLIHPDDMPTAMEVFQRTMSGETMPSSELRLLANSGVYVCVEYVTTPLFKDGKVIGNLNVVRDITERKRAQEALRRAHDELEIRVEERTGELSHANKLLQAEITERRRAEEELRHSEERYRLLAETMLQGVVHQDADGKIISMNPAAELILGKNPAEFLGETSVSVEHHTVREDGSPFPDLEHPAMVALRTGQKLRDVVMGVYNPREQCYRWINISAMPLFRPGEDRPHQVYTVFEDITERKQAEEALRKVHDELEVRVQERTAELEESNKKLLESEEKYRELAESIGEVFYAMDRELRYIYWNNASEALTGILAKDAIGKSLFELFPELEGTKVEKLYKEVLITKQPRHFVNKYRAGGKNLFFEINAYPSNLGISIIAKDITERKRAEEQVREQATLLDKARDAIEVRDLDNRLIYWNKSAQRMYGWTAGEAIGKNANELLYKGESQKLIEAQKNVLEKGEWAGELYQVTKEGKEIIVESHWTLVNDDERRPKSILIINTDITEKKKLETQFLRAQRMESIGTLAGGIAHDLNNMLTPIMLSLQILKERSKDEQSQRLFNILETNTQRGANLIKQVMTFARGIEGERVTIQLAPLISEITKIIKETFPRSIEIQTKICDDLWTISGDVTQLHQVLMNLCVNARDAMPHGGTLSIFAENLFIEENQAKITAEARAGPYIVIKVSDTGTGIQPEILDRIFEPFFTTKEHGKGTGLGLSTTLAIVKGHGGFLDVDSKVKKGTTFKVYLPAVEKVKEQNVEELQLEFSSEEKGLILVVDDEDSVRDVTREALEKSKFKVITANDGVEAVRLYSQNRQEIKAVLMDMMMPVMDGQTSIRELRTVNPGVKIIAISGLTEKDKLEKVADTYIDAFLMKPYTTEKLLKTISEVLNTE